ncbi:MAG: ethanolamine ammonia-lyase [Epulopiscium sp. Nuni2H_MBin003]|nr:MAG: ethanolamine ammonia-lyase [Epulopiscium sp. Nuni2H_MBin003]
MELLSVGIDIGTSTTQLIFSKLILQNMASSYTIPRLVIVDKQIVYLSEIYFTPLISNTEIDIKKVRKIVEEEYEKAGITAIQVDTGAVIITGETARKSNAKVVLETLSDLAGDFVVATAGPDLESIISGKGAGASAYSKENNIDVTNIDIGGGTSNIVVFKRGETVETGCMDIGGRLIKIDPISHKITYITNKLLIIIDKHNLNIKIGDTINANTLKPIIDILVRALEVSVGLEAEDDNFKLLVTNKSIHQQTEYISFSGGVADYIEKVEEDIFKYGDIGILLAQGIKKSTLYTKRTIIESKQTIRATVVGAGTHTTEISGSTITYTVDNFPLKNIPILKMTKEDENDLAKAIRDKLMWYKIDNELEQVVIAILGKKNPTFDNITEFATAIIEGAKELIDKYNLLIIVVEEDMGKVLGQAIYRMLGYKKDIICLDSIMLDNGDYIDIGKPIADGMVLPVVVKTIVFNR